MARAEPHGGNEKSASVAGHRPSVVDFRRSLSRPCKPHGEKEKNPLENLCVLCASAVIHAATESTRLQDARLTVGGLACRERDSPMPSEQQYTIRRTFFLQASAQPPSNRATPVPRPTVNVRLTPGGRLSPSSKARAKWEPHRSSPRERVLLLPGYQRLVEAWPERRGRLWRTG